MSKPTALASIPTIAWCLAACTIVDHQPTLDDSGGTGGPSDNEVCIAQLATLSEIECPPGLSPYAEYDGGASTVVLIDDPGVGVGLGAGLVVYFHGEAGADWVGYQVLQNSKCTMGCRAPDCPQGQTGCFSIDEVTYGLCAYYCSNDAIDEEACKEFSQECEIGRSGTGGSGGLDETGGSGGSDEADGETTGGAHDERYDCSQWHPETIRPPMPGGPFLLPQALVDELVRSDADALIECDGVRLRQRSDGHWVISQMRSGGLAGALGLRIGDELTALDDVELDSLEAVIAALDHFVEEDGDPRQLSPDHPGFTLRIRRGQGSFPIALRVVPSAMGSTIGP